MIAFVAGAPSSGAVRPPQLRRQFRHHRLERVEHLAELGQHLRRHLRELGILRGCLVELALRGVGGGQPLTGGNVIGLDFENLAIEPNGGAKLSGALVVYGAGKRLHQRAAAPRRGRLLALRGAALPAIHGDYRSVAGGVRKRPSKRPLTAPPGSNQGPSAAQGLP